MKPVLPQGYRATHLLTEYEQGAVDVLNAHSRMINGANFTTLREIEIDWREDGFNRETDTQLVIDPQGKVVAYADLWDIDSLHVRMFALVAVDPDHMGCGIGSYLAGWLIERARKNVSRAPEGARVVLHQSLNSEHKAAYELLTRSGFQVVRHSYRMRIDLNEATEETPAPEGIVIRTIRPGEEERAVIYAAYDSFRDHWGHIDEPFDEYHKRWMYMIENDPNYDPSLYFVAMDGDEVAGVSLCYPRLEEDPGMAWVGTLGVRRAWRKRGLGLALLRHSFAEFHRRGIPRAGLGVDAQNLTGALRLYEKAGMRVWRKSAMYEYELRSGRDLMKQSLED